MSRDYKSTPSKKPAPKKKSSPLLAGVAIGLFVGLAAAISVAIYIYRGPSPFVDREKTAASSEETAAKEAPAAKTAKNTPAKEPEAAKAPEKPRFDFYTILPGSEEPVTERDMKQAGKPGDSAASEHYFLQAGAFQTASEADNLKARLALIGVEAVIQTASLPDKGTLHRVRVGPYATIDDLNRVRTLLTQNGIASTPMKIRDTPPQ